jgi:hypothetical protein
MNARIRWSGPVMTLLVAAAAGIGAQQPSQSSPQTSPYQGVSHPPADEVIETSTIPEAKPPAGKPLDAQPPATSQTQPPAPQPTYNGAQGQPLPPDASTNFQGAQLGDGTDDGIVRVAPSSGASAALNSRSLGFDPDSDIVHPHPLRQGELQEGTAIRVRLLDRLSTSDSVSGEPFHTRVATDVLEGGRVILPAGSEIDGRVMEVSSGHLAGHGTMRLNPESVVLPNGTRFRLHAEVSSTPGSNTRVAGEGIIQPGSRLKRDGIEYGGAVGAGAVTGAIVAGPVGALTGSLIGAGAITVHLLVNHPQATLESGTSLVFVLTDRLYLAPETLSGN